MDGVKLSIVACCPHLLYTFLYISVHAEFVNVFIYLFVINPIMAMNALYVLFHASLFFLFNGVCVYTLS